MGFENDFNGIYFHHHFYLKTGVSRNGLSFRYSKQDTRNVMSFFFKEAYKINLFFQRAIPRNKALVTEPKTSPVPKIEATAKTLDWNQIP